MSPPVLPVRFTRLRILQRRRLHLERVGVPQERYIFSWDVGAFKSLDNIFLDAPRHRTYKAVRRRRRVGGIDFQYFCDERRVVRDPVAHHDPPTRLRHPDHLLRHVERSGREHGTEHGHNEVEYVIAKLFEIRRIALLKPAIGKCEFCGPPVACCYKIGGDIDAQDICRKSCSRQRCRSIAAPEIEHFETLRDVQRPDQFLTAFPHGLGDAREIPPFPTAPCSRSSTVPKRTRDCVRWTLPASDPGGCDGKHSKACTRKQADHSTDPEKAIASTGPSNAMNRVQVSLLIQVASCGRAAGP